MRTWLKVVLGILGIFIGIPVVIALIGATLFVVTEVHDGRINITVDNKMPVDAGEFSVRFHVGWLPLGMTANLSTRYWALVTPGEDYTAMLDDANSSWSRTAFLNVTAIVEPAPVLVPMPEPAPAQTTICLPEVGSDYCYGPG